MRRLVVPGLLSLMFLAACSKFADNGREGAVSGTIEMDETRVASRYGGRVEEILQREGAALEPGQLLARLNAAELEARRQLAEAVLAELKAGPRPQEIQAAKDDWQSLDAQLEFTREDARRVADLFAQNTVAAAERDRAVAQANALEKTAAAAKSRYDLLLAGTRPERIAQAEAQLREIETQLREMQIFSPTNAVLEVLHVKVGDVPGPNQPIATLILPAHLWVRVFVPEPWLGHIKVGEKVTVKVDSFPEKSFEGEVEQIARAAEFTPRNVQTVSDRVKQVFGVKVRLPSGTDDLRAGMAADVFFPRIPAELR